MKRDASQILERMNIEKVWLYVIFFIFRKFQETTTSHVLNLFNIGGVFDD